METETDVEATGIDACDCCGQYIRLADAAAFSDERPICRDCGGDPAATTREKRHGWAYTTFIDARIPVLADRLNDQNRARFLAMSWERKATVIEKMILKGAMI